MLRQRWTERERVSHVETVRACNVETEMEREIDNHVETEIKRQTDILRLRYKKRRPAILRLRWDIVREACWERDKEGDSHVETKIDGDRESVLLIKTEWVIEKKWACQTHWDQHEQRESQQCWDRWIKPTIWRLREKCVQKQIYELTEIAVGRERAH